MSKFVHQRWSSKLAFVLATTGAAVGLGNLWGFPFLAGENGGAAFVLIYLVCVAVIAIPIIIAEIAIGRMGQLSPIGTLDALIKAQKASNFWKAIGYLSLAVPFVGFTFYSVVAGWALNYSIRSATGTLAGLTPETSGGLFGNYTADPLLSVGLQGLVILATAFVIGRGLRRGIEWATKIMMPGLFLILVGMIIYGMVAADFAGAVKFLFAPDFSGVTTKTVMVALGQAFFSIGVGVGFMITYGAYLPKAADIPKSAATIAGIDTLVAIFAGLAIFPIVFAAGLNPGEGLGLVFITMPVAFGVMPLGQLVGTLFFLLLFVAAFTSTLGMLEPIVSTMEEKWQDKSRFVLAFGAAMVIWLVGLAPALSASVLSDVRPLSFIPALADRDVFTSFYFLTLVIMLPLNGFLIALFAGWVIKKSDFKKQLGFKSDWLFNAWHLLLKFLAPLAVLAITYFGLIG